MSGKFKSDEAKAVWVAKMRELKEAKKQKMIEDAIAARAAEKEKLREKPALPQVEAGPSQQGPAPEERKELKAAEAALDATLDKLEKKVEQVAKSGSEAQVAQMIRVLDAQIEQYQKAARDFNAGVENGTFVARVVEKEVREGMRMLSKKLLGPLGELDTDDLYKATKFALKRKGRWSREDSSDSSENDDEEAPDETPPPKKAAPPPPISRRPPPAVKQYAAEDDEGVEIPTAEAPAGVVRHEKQKKLEGERDNHTFRLTPSTDPEKYAVKKMKQTNANEDFFDPLLPRHPFFMLCVGPRGSGKSNCLIDMVANKFKPTYWDLIIIYCKTIMDDDKWTPILKWVDKDLIRTKYTEEQLMKDYEIISHMHDHWPRFKSLILMDDMISDNFANKYKIDAVGMIATMGRHKGISMGITSQLYRALSPAMRNNCTNLCIFNVHNAKEIDKLAEENQGLMDRDNFRGMLHSIWGAMDNSTSNDSERPFLHVNANKDFHERFSKNWDQVIVIGGLKPEERVLEGGESDHAQYEGGGVKRRREKDDDDYEGGGKKREP